MENQKHIYVVISRTTTKFAHCLQLIGGLQYNHASISLDSQLTRLYAFARPQHNAVFLGKLVRETLDRYTLKKDKEVPVVIFKVPVTDIQYRWTEATIERIYNDPEYMYNLISVITFPLIKGFNTYKTFTCVEFVTHILHNVGYKLEKPSYQYTPDDLKGMLDKYVIFEGDMREYMAKETIDTAYFASMTFKTFFKNCKAICKLMRRVAFSS